MAAPHSRDRISVDLRGLKAALIERAAARGLSLSDFVRNLVVEALRADADEPEALRQAPAAQDVDRVRLSVRLTRPEVRVLAEAAHAARLPAGALIARLVASPGLWMVHGDIANHRAALIASNAEMATLSRNLRHLTDLLRHGEVKAAAEYRATLNAAAGDIRAHLQLAGEVLNDMRSDERRAAASSRHVAQHTGDVT